MNMKKLLAVAVIFLFIGLAFAPSINANVSSLEKETVEFTTEVCGLNGGKQTVQLTKAEAEEVEALFDSIRAQLNETETREESEEIFKEAVVELDKYGLLGGLSVKQAQRLVTGGYQNSRIMKALEKMSDRHENIFDNNSNFLCLVAGETTHTIVFGLSLALPLALVNLVFSTLRFLIFLPLHNFIYCLAEKYFPRLYDWLEQFYYYRPEIPIFIVLLALFHWPINIAGIITLGDSYEYFPDDIYI